MKSFIEGKVVSSAMKDTVVVEVTYRTPHPLYKKLMKRTRKYKADSKEVQAVVGDVVRIVSIRPLSKDKHFKVMTNLTQNKKENQA